MAIIINSCSYCYLVPQKSYNQINHLKNVQFEILTKDGQEFISDCCYIQNDTLFIKGKLTLLKKKVKLTKIPLSSVISVRCCEFKGKRAQKAGIKFALIIALYILITRILIDPLPAGLSG
jgi:hypothetical protein